mmetsp:Transcript_14691/g.34233  ORF Transcript_14691/g.34233 Transcript_14691/m.34233 type:complete len:215 (-) Transcript_14691:1439-2083(-)
MRAELSLRAVDARNRKPASAAGLRAQLACEEARERAESRRRAQAEEELRGGAVDGGQVEQAQKLRNTRAQRATAALRRRRRGGGVLGARARARSLKNGANGPRAAQAAASNLQGRPRPRAGHLCEEVGSDLGATEECAQLRVGDRVQDGVEDAPLRPRLPSELLRRRRLAARRTHGRGACRLGCSGERLRLLRTRARLAAAEHVTRRAEAEGLA